VNRPLKEEYERKRASRSNVWRRRSDMHDRLWKI